MRLSFIREYDCFINMPLTAIVFSCFYTYSEFLFSYSQKKICITLKISYLITFFISFELILLSFK